MTTSPFLKTIGYWRGGGQWKFPRPQWFVRPGWREDDRDRILSYLRNAPCYAASFGYSWCRFRTCDVPYEQMGSSDRTDGEWVWPAGLAHYVEEHEVMLPDEFVQTMIRNDWTVPSSAEEARSRPTPADLNLKGDMFDFNFWLAWSRRHARRPWFWPW